MDFRLSEEQAMLRDTLSRYLSDHYRFDSRQAVVRSDAGWRPECWRAFASELGLLGVGIPERFGGLGGGMVEHMVVMEQFGRHLVLEPYLGTVVLAAGALQHGGDALAAEMLPAIVAGQVTAGWAHAEPGSRHGFASVQATARETSDGYRLSGHKAVVTGAPWATHFVVSAQAGDGFSLFWVERAASGVTLRETPTFDGGRAADLLLDNVHVPASHRLGTPGDTLPGYLSDAGAVALCAEATGCLARMLEDTIEYARQRRQFGQPIGQFQALQHRMADMYMLNEQAIAITQVAAMSMEGDDRTRALAASSAKAHIGEAGRVVGQGAVQIHGGMGVTEEAAVGHYFKRVTAIDLQFGSAAWHQRRCADLLYPAAA